MKKKAPFIVRFFKSLLITIIVLALILCAVYFFVKIKFDIDLIDTVKQINTITKPVNENELYKNKFSDEDMESAQVNINVELPDFISGNKEEGFTINENISVLSMSADIELTDKQTAAIVNNLIKNNQKSANITLDGNEILPELIQVEFSNVEENKADVNVVFKIDISFLKEKMNQFPLNILKDKIPNYIYVSSTVTVNKNSGKFDYTITSKELKINQLSAKGTKDLLTTINKIAKFGSYEDFNIQIGSSFVNAMIGNASNQGFCYALKDVVEDYNFVCRDNVNYLVLVHKV